MSVDPNIDYHAHDPEDDDARSDDPVLREAQELEEKMRRALATKEDPLRDDESTSARLRRLEEEGAGTGADEDAHHGETARLLIDRSPIPCPRSGGPGRALRGAGDRPVPGTGAHRRGSGGGISRNGR